MSQQEETTPKGRGYFNLSVGLMQALEIKLPEPLTGNAPYVEVQAVFDELGRKLFLPEGYQLVALYFVAMNHSFMAVVESEAIPVVAQGADMPRLDLTYNRHDETDEVTLLKIEATWTEQRIAEVYSHDRQSA